MAEVKFVLKSIIIAVLLTALLQVQIGNDTLETRAEIWLRSSVVSTYLQGVASGAVKLIKSASKSVTGLLAQKTNIFSGQVSEKAVKGPIDLRHSFVQSSESEEQEDTD